MGETTLEIEAENVPICVVSGCTFRFNSNQKRFKVYQFPDTPEMIEKWTKKLKLSNLTPSPNTG